MRNFVEGTFADVAADKGGFRSPEMETSGLRNSTGVGGGPFPDAFQ
ncbi:hypothetical protein [Streptosporangium subroseum]|nr:hypothetical protein OHB15_20285 [Streptosporangium subroseum]